MRYLVLGAGLQGRAVLHDLAKSEAVERIVAADSSSEALAAAAHVRLGTEGIERRLVDARDEGALARALAGFDVAVEMLPAELQLCVAKAALEAGVNLVNCHYAGELSSLDDEVRAAGLRFLPEAGLDPGVDLVLASVAVHTLDEVHALHSYGAGFPEP